MPENFTGNNVFLTDNKSILPPGHVSQRLIEGRFGPFPSSSVPPNFLVQALDQDRNPVPVGFNAEASAATAAGLGNPGGGGGAIDQALVQALQGPVAQPGTDAIQSSVLPQGLEPTPAAAPAAPAADFDRIMLNTLMRGSPPVTGHSAQIFNQAMRNGTVPRGVMQALQHRPEFGHLFEADSP